MPKPQLTKREAAAVIALCNEAIHAENASWTPAQIRVQEDALAKLIQLRDA